MTSEAQMREQFEAAFRRVYGTFCRMHAQVQPDRDIRRQLHYMDSQLLWEEAIKAATEQMKPLVEALREWELELLTGELTSNPLVKTHRIRERLSLILTTIEQKEME